MRRLFTYVVAWFRHLTRRAKTAAVFACVLALAAVSFELRGPVSRLLNPPCMEQGATIVTHQGQNGECVGITDGSFVFDPRMRDVEQKVLTENRQVTRDHPNDYVSVVLLLPISSASGSIMSMTNVVEQVEGAFTAQYDANRNSVEGISPYIQLLIGSDGYQANQSQAAAGIIENAPALHIAAASGLGLSLAGTEDAVNRLTARQIPVFGATLTSDAFNNVKDFVRVSAGNADNTAVALSYVESTYARAFLIEDENSGDSYDTTLVNGFKKFADIKGHQIVGVESYDTTDRDSAHQSKADQQEAENEVNTRISQMPVNICAAQPAVVLFGGRGQDLGTLLHSFANACLDKPITIVSGDDVTNLPDTAQLRQDLAGKVTVEYAGVAHPQEWNTNHHSPATPEEAEAEAEAEGVQGFHTFDAAFQPLFPGASLTDGNTMMAYDATLSAISAIRLTGQPQPQPEAVANELGALQGAHKVLGASGPIQFTADYRTSESGSNPVDKAVPILRLTPDGTSQVITVEWPPGTPASP